MKRKLAALMTMTMALSSMAVVPAMADNDEEPYVCKIVCVGDATTEACDAVAEAASEILLEKYNIEIELVRLGYGTFYNEVNLMLSSGEKLDLIPNFAFNTMTAVNTGQILELDDLLDEYGQGIKEIVSEGEWNCVTFDGSIFAVPNNKEKAQGFGIAMRKDMLDAVDFDLDTIETEEDLEALYAAIKEEFPDVYPLASDQGQMGYHMIERDDLGGDYGVIINPSTAEEAVVVNYYETEEYQEMVKRHYDWAQKGYILPDATNHTEDAGTLIGAGKCFAYYTNTKPGIESEWERKTGVEMVVKEIVSPFQTTSGVSNQWYIAYQSEDPAKAMQVLNEIYTNPDLSNLLINGIEGEHYVKNDDGTISYPEGVDSANTTYSSVAWVWPNELITTPWSADGADVWELTDEFNKSANESIALGFTWDNANVLNEITACNNVKAKYENALNCGMIDPEEALPKMIEELKSAGLEAIIEEKQAQLDDWMAGKAEE
ncbi:MAG: ABC transporter substrate-binding protein [Lachnospiraceae bacterium]|nr:ABC transporter substrate-binding protein [Lachnospiraceae bacterium]